MAANKRQRVAAPPKYPRGAIYRIKLHNFMSYTDAEIVDPGPNLNCIIGPNGTGKSSIVCAMCVGLGGELKVTERGDKISACVHGNGKAMRDGVPITKGFVETELWEGNGPGKNLVVKVEFTIEDKQTWTLDGAPSTKKAVREAMKSLNIHVDNPLQFLPQDKVGQFSNLSPVELLKYTEMAIGPELHAKHNDLINMDKHLKEMKVSLQTESKALAGLEEQNNVLERDVERWRKYKANLDKLENMEGKKLWKIHDAAFDEFEAVQRDYDGKKKECKQLDEQKKRLDEQQAPLKKLVDQCKSDRKKHMERAQKFDEERTVVGQSCETLLEGTIDENREALRGVDKEFAKLRAARDRKQQELDDAVAQVEREEQQLSQENGQDVQVALRNAKHDLDTAQDEEWNAESDVTDHDRAAGELRRKVEWARGAQAEMNDVTKLKRQLVMRKNRQSGELAHFAEDSGLTEADVLGPLLMHFDIPNKQHARLAEQALSDKHTFAHLARSNQARDTLNRKVKEHDWKVNVYRYEGKPFRPRTGKNNKPRPAANELKQFGVTSWLDEAIDVAPELKGEVLGALAELASIDTYLLGTERTVQCSEALQAYLTERGFDDYKILTPSRTFRASRSRYGQKAHLVNSSVPGQPQNTFAMAVDPQRKKQVEAELLQAEAGLEEHGRKRAPLVQRQAAAAAAKAEATERKKAIDGRFVRLESLRGRVKTFRERLTVAEKNVDKFDIDARKRQWAAKLREAHEKAAEADGKLTRNFKQTAEALTLTNGSTVALKAAEAQLHESQHQNEELEEKRRSARAEFDSLKARAKELAKGVQEKQQKAEQKAPHLKAGERDEENERIWNELPDRLDELEQEIEALNEETSNDTASESSLKKYQERKAKIEEMKVRLEETKSNCDEKEQELRTLEGEWKPELESMVNRVGDNFSNYFSRFRCMGEVALTDGRQIDDTTGLPVGDDDYAKYKIHIKVKWRANEQLHVLGDEGRDSGGERSVATMIYLISLQNFNPAPFRVVDEINQAMDSSNERNVFDCVTHACRDGGKQYFLLTPKLLPDLNYGEDTVIQLVFNGPYMQQRSVLALDNYV